MQNDHLQYKNYFKKAPHTTKKKCLVGLGPYNYISTKMTTIVGGGIYFWLKKSSPLNIGEMIQKCFVNYTQ